MLSKREIIILSLAGIAAVYGAVTLWPSEQIPPQSTRTQHLKQVTGFKSEILSQLHELSRTDNSSAAVSGLLTEKWTSDPFYSPPSAEESGEPEVRTLSATTFSYTGYIKMGPVRIAVINASEYEQGEDLEQEGYKLHSIRPDRVLIREKRSGRSILVPFIDIEEPHSAGDSAATPSNSGQTQE